jgi:uncharacterized lipoprotein YmbA
MKISMRAVFLAVGLLYGGCGTSPNTTYYSLAAVSGKVREASLGTIEVRRPGIAGYLDRSEVLAQWDGQRLELAHNTAWAEPIAAMIGRVLADNLSDRLHGTIAFGASSDLSIQASTVIELAIRKFDLSSDGNVHLNALWSLRGAGQPATHAVALQARLATTDTGAVVAAMSGLLGQLADEITSALLARANNQPPTVEPP